MLEYFLIKANGETTGTFSIEQIRAMLNSGFIEHDTRYWHEGVTEWKPIDQIEESLKFEKPQESEPARTIPSYRIAQVLKAVPPPSTKIEKLKTPSRPPVTAVGPFVLPSTIEPEMEEDQPGDELEPTLPGPVETPVPATLPSRGSSFREKMLYVLLGAFLVLTLERGPSIVHHIDEAMAPKVTLSGDETFVLLDQGTIKLFHQDMGNSPTIQLLEGQMARTAEPMALQRLKLGIETERARHTEQVREQYLQGNTAAYIDPGIYRVMGSFDEDGNAVAPAKDQPLWVSINYHRHTVYAFKSPNSANPVAPTP